MKAFEEKFPRPSIDQLQMCFYFYYERQYKREGWKAALEWALRNKRFCRECDYNIDVDIIKEELEKDTEEWGDE